MLPAGVATRAFSSVVVTLPAISSGRGQAGLMEGIEKIREEAREEGLRLGFTEGQTDGLRAGYEAGYHKGRQQAAEEAAREAEQVGNALALEVGALHERIEGTWQEFLTEVETAMTDRCLQTVRELLDAELQIGRSSALNIVRRCLGEVVHATSIKIRVASQDLPYLQDFLKDERVQLVADGSIDAGCVIESSSGTVDGTLRTSLQLLENAWDEAA